MYHLLIADDEKIEREGMCYLVHMCSLPFDVYQADNGMTALKMMQEISIDVLLTDIKMPFMDGLALIERARSMKPNLRTVILSAYGEFSYAQKAIGLRVKNYILKPIQVNHFCSVMKEIVQELDETQNEQPESRNQTPCLQAIEQVLRIIHTQYGADLSLEYLANQVNLSPAYLSALFKNECGETLVKYLRDYRLSEACKLLTHTNLKIADVGRMVGYPDAAYFGAVFKKCFHKSPAEFRGGR